MKLKKKEIEIIIQSALLRAYREIMEGVSGDITLGQTLEIEQAEGTVVDIMTQVYEQNQKNEAV